MIGSMTGRKAVSTAERAGVPKRVDWGSILVMDFVIRV